GAEHVAHAGLRHPHVVVRGVHVAHRHALAAVDHARGRHEVSFLRTLQVVDLHLDVASMAFTALPGTVWATAMAPATSTSVGNSPPWTAVRPQCISLSTSTHAMPAPSLATPIFIPSLRWNVGRNSGGTSNW